MMAQRWLDGAVLYQDVADMAPPLIVWLYALPALLAPALNLPSYLVLKLGVILLVATVLKFSSSILDRSALWQGREKQVLILAMAAMLLLANHSVVFAQREHLLAVFLLPYVLLTMPSVDRETSPAWMQAAAGVLAATGLCIKPHFFIIWGCGLLWRMRARRSWRILIAPIEIIIVTMAVLYLLAITVFFPQYLEWLHIVGQSYRYYGYIIDTPLSVAIWFALMGAIAIAIAWMLGLFSMLPQTAYRNDVRYLMVVAAGAYLQAVLQFKTWEYISYPLQVFGMLAVFAFMLQKPLNNFLAFAVAALAFYPMTPMADQRHEKQEVVREMLASYRDIADMYYVSSYLADAALYRAHPPLKWVNRFNSFNYMLFGIMERSPLTGQPLLKARAGREWMERWLLDAISEDIENNHPGLIVIKNTYLDDYPRSEYFDFIKWFEGDKKMNRVLAKYKLRQTVNGCEAPEHCVFYFFTRRAGEPQ